jgi:hypothetical protein
MKTRVQLRLDGLDGMHAPHGQIVLIHGTFDFASDADVHQQWLQRQGELEGIDLLTW